MRIPIVLSMNLMLFWCSGGPPSEQAACQLAGQPAGQGSDLISRRRPKHFLHCAVKKRFHMNPFLPRGKKMKFAAGKKNGFPLLGNPFFSPLRPASARPGHGRQAGPIFFSPPRAGQGMPVGLPLFWTKYPISHWFYKVFCDFRLQVESAFEQNTPFSIGFIRFFAISASRWNPLLSKIPHFLLVL